jgi:hypothetical protein
MVRNPVNVVGGSGVWNNMDQHVDPSINPNIFVSGMRTWIYTCAIQFSESGEITHTRFVPVGVMQGYSWGEQKQIELVFELGSELPYLIPGRTTGSIQLSRILVGGADLTNCLQQAKSAGEISGLSQNELIRSLRDIATPINIAFVSYAVNGDPKVSRMFRNCWITGRSENLSAGATIVSEGVSIIYSDIPNVEFKF